RHRHRATRAEADLPQVLPGGSAARARSRWLRVGAEHRRYHRARARRLRARPEPRRSRQYIPGLFAVPRILIVEDEPALMRGLKDSFSGRGYQVLAATDGAKGMDLALSACPDLILLDIMLPRMNGFEICRAIRERNSEMPILMVTAKGQEEDVILGL